MKTNLSYEFVAGCSANGCMVMDKHFADAFIAFLRDSALASDGIRLYYDFLALGALCEELRRDVDAMDAYMYVFDHVIWDAGVSLSAACRRRLRMLAIDGLLRLAGSMEEVVWEICSQVTYPWRNVG